MADILCPFCRTPAGGQTDHRKYTCPGCKSAWWAGSYTSSDPDVINPTGPVPPDRLHKLWSPRVGESVHADELVARVAGKAATGNDTPKWFSVWGRAVAPYEAAKAARDAGWHTTVFDRDADRVSHTLDHWYLPAVPFAAAVMADQPAAAHVVHAVGVLTDAADPAAAYHTLRQLVRPGGLLVVEEAKAPGWLYTVTGEGLDNLLSPPGLRDEPADGWETPGTVIRVVRVLGRVVQPPAVTPRRQ